MNKTHIQRSTIALITRSNQHLQEMQQFLSPCYTFECISVLCVYVCRLRCLKFLLFRSHTHTHTQIYTKDVGAKILITTTTTRMSVAPNIIKMLNQKQNFNSAFGHKIYPFSFYTFYFYSRNFTINSNLAD